VKNLNSFRFLKAALEHEIERQVALIESGGRGIQETRLFNPQTGENVGMRRKEHAHDYRYFPEPDMVPPPPSEAWINYIPSAMPELPAARRARFVTAYGLRDYDAEVLTLTRETGDYFEEVVRDAGDAKAAANWVTSELAGMLKAEGKTIIES